MKNFASMLLTLACFTFLANAKAVSPSPDGGYPGENTAEGTSALLHLNGGSNNTAVGWASLGFDVTGNLNTAVGAGTLVFNTADSNTATGAAALLSNTIAFQNTATGAFALFSNISGSNNTAVGADALFSNTDGFRNNALGILALSTHQTGNFNNAFGALALAADQSGTSNNAFGDEALHSNTTGTNNTAMGDLALHNNNAGRNCAFGAQALQSNTSGGDNTAVGFAALLHNTVANDNTAIGFGALVNNTTGHGNIAVGPGAGETITTASGVICIGSIGANVNNACFIDNIRGVQTQNGDGIPVVIDSAGQLGTTSSSKRFKKDITPMENASEALLALKPATFYYENDDTKTPQFGLVAEQVSDVDPRLVVRDKNGDPYTVRYDAVNAMLLNEFLKEHRKVEKLEAALEAVNARLDQHESKIATVINRKLKSGTPAHRPGESDPQVICGASISVSDR